ncbi:MAG: EF-hand domain-containing protein [Solirubrobacterales bacterium]
MVIVLVLAVPAMAAAQQKDADFFRMLDTNGDGVIDREEFSLQKGTILYALDKNRNLKIDQNETKLPPEKFDQYAGADHVIDGLELFTMPEAQFEAFDRNRDQQITLDEFRQQLAVLRGGPQTSTRKKK